jgi:hypothetical protein
LRGQDHKANSIIARMFADITHDTSRNILIAQYLCRHILKNVNSQKLRLMLFRRLMT